MKMWETSSGKPKEIEVLRRTDHNVWVPHTYTGSPVRCSLNHIGPLFNSYEEARRYLIRQARRKRDDLQLQLEAATRWVYHLIALHESDAEEDLQ